MGLEFREIRPSDWERVRQIYREGLSTGQASFETDAPTWPRWDADHLPTCRIAAIDRGVIVGWAALTRFSPRAVYRGVAEVSIYVAADRRGQGIGSDLMGELVRRSETAGFWTLLGKVFPENERSLNIVERHGFRRVGTLEKVGRHGGKWRDVILVERRSAVPE